VSEIAVFGSINMDLTLSVESFPEPGETVKARDFKRLPGGKGANQAVAAARLGGDVSMFGLVGRGPFADDLKNNLDENEVNTENIETIPGTSGFAVVSVDNHGENQITVVPGANGKIDDGYILKVADIISGFDILLLQLETPLRATIDLLKRLPEKRPEVILDPAPAVHYSALPLDSIDFLTPNESELDILTEAQNIQKGVSNMLDSGLEALVLKQGRNGARYLSSKKECSVEAFEVRAVDSTGAGDAFNGALAVALAEGKEISDAIKFANAGGACAVMGKGAQSSLPTKKDIDELARI